MSSRIIFFLVVIFFIVAGIILYFRFYSGRSRVSLNDKEAIRQQKVKAELKLTYVEPLVTDIIARLKNTPEVTDQEIITYRDGVRKLMEAAPLMKTLYQKQIGASPDDRIHAKTDDDRELIDRYGHPWCIADTGELCVALPSIPPRTSGIVPDDVECDDIASVGSPFEGVVREKDGSLKAVPYREMWPDEIDKSAKIFREAADIFKKIPREEKLALHLHDLSDAFNSSEPFPFYKSDKSWIDLLNSESLFFVRIGPDEVGGDGVGDKCESKARYHFNLAMVNKETGKTVEKLSSKLDLFDKKLADLVDDPENYQASKVQIKLPVFMDVIYQNGDDVGGPNGTNIGQTLPNWCGKDGKSDCMRGTMIYVNKTVKAYSDELMKKYIMPLFDPALKGYFNSSAGIDSVVYHEIYHNIGPKDKKRKPGKDVTYGDTLVTEKGVSWKLPIEELKAQTGSLFIASELYKEAINKFETGKLTEEEYKAAEKRFREHIVYDMAWALRMVLRAIRSGKDFTSTNPYSRLAAVQIGYLTEKEALNFKEGKWYIDFDKMPEAINELTGEMGKLYANADADEVEKFFLYYMRGEGVHLLHQDRLIEVAGGMPSVLFNYQIKGL